MAESPSPSALPSRPQPDPVAGVSDSDYWCYHCEKRVSVETLPNLPDLVCLDCNHGFVESIPAAPSDPSLGSHFIQVLRLIAQAAHDDDAPPLNPPSDDEFLRIGLDSWENDETDDDEDQDDEDDDDVHETEQNVNEEEGAEATGEEEEDRSNDLIGENRDESEIRRRRREVLHLRIQDMATRARSGRNRILDWAEILMGLDDNSIELRLEVPETDRFIGNPADYVDDAGYQALLQNLAESDSGRRGAPPAAKSAVSDLPKVEVKSKEGIIACAICKDAVNVGEIATNLPCGHSYHGDCIVPWLGVRNTCPVCRYELPTDDPDYEEDRKKNSTLNSGSASGSTSAGDDSR